jgi:3'-phosphoadenosine 5'-phosphosulfate sulfotransferase (PAPS reductase)/FAD synthetase
VRDPFEITGPAVVNFSGGRTSGMMLYRILEAHGGVLPDDVRVVFCNTGKERPETLDFVERCSCEWGVPVVWLEYRWERGRGPFFAVVDYATADRDSGPLEAAITARSGDSGFLPNQIVRYCTIECKILTTIRYLESLGWTGWASAIGFRSDEPARVAKARTGKNRDEREEPVFPMHAAGLTKANVAAFWERQPFDLQLGPDEGNCDLCFLKGWHKLVRILRGRPDLADWWIRMEARKNTRFRKDRPRYAALLELSRRPQIPGTEDDGPDELSVACHCTD